MNKRFDGAISKSSRNTSCLSLIFPELPAPDLIDAARLVIDFTPMTRIYVYRHPTVITCIPTSISMEIHDLDFYSLHVYPQFLVLNQLHRYQDCNIGVQDAHAQDSRCAHANRNHISVASPRHSALRLVGALPPPSCRLQGGRGGIMRKEGVVDSKRGYY
eukprot:749647-Hanusia_phi.AAC.2